MHAPSVPSYQSHRRVRASLAQSSPSSRPVQRLPLTTQSSLPLPLVADWPDRIQSDGPIRSTSVDANVGIMMAMENRSGGTLARPVNMLTRPCSSPIPGLFLALLLILLLLSISCLSPGVQGEHPSTGEVRNRREEFNRVRDLVT